MKTPIKESLPLSGDEKYIKQQQDDIAPMPLNVSPTHYEEVKQSDLKSRHPNLDFNQDYYFAQPKGDLSKLTLDNLMSLKKKFNGMYHANKKEYEFYKEAMESDFNEWVKIRDEIKKRLKYINSPIPEGVGAGDPSKDPKAVGRWTIKFDSDSKMLKNNSKILDKKSENEIVEQTIKKILDGFDPTSIGPRPNGSQGTEAFDYESENEKMRHMEC